MEQTFQTSFIPKKPVVEKRVTESRPIGLFTIVAIFFFLATCLGYGGLYLYKESLLTSLADKVSNLKKANSGFEIEKIAQLQELDRRLRSSTEVLKRHIVVNPIFKELSLITVKTVRFTKFSYTLGTPRIAVKLSGQGRGYTDVAIQSQLFAKDKNFIDPVFSNLVLDDKGKVSFDVDFFVDASFVDYKQALKRDGTGSLDIPNDLPL